MNRCFSSMPAVVSAALLQLCASKSDGCETGSGSITNLPPNPGSGYQVFGINAGGQLTGFFFIVLANTPVRRSSIAADSLATSELSAAPSAKATG